MLVLLFSLLLFCGTSQGKLYKLTVETADTFGAGTDAEIRIQIQGTEGNVKERVIHGSFEQDGTDRIDVNDHDIGLITGMDIRRDKSGIFPDWKLDKITIKVSGEVDSIFKYYKWVGANKWIKLPLSCPSGYGVNAQDYCDFVDQCTQGRCNTVTSTCENLPGDYRCICKTGYQNSDPKTCINVNECNLGRDTCDKATSTCADSEGSFYCRCKDGYTHGANNKICEDIDECKQSKCDYITSTCENLPGDYRCICRQGYQNVNSKTCKNVNECDLGKDTCDKATSTCEDNGGSFFCRCKDGYTQGANNKICQAIKCGPVSVPATSIMTPARCTQLDANVFGDKCVMTCKHGYVIDDIQHGTLTCGSSGRWEGNMGTCNPVQCPALLAIANGKIHPLTCTTSGGSYPYTCTYSCVSGYTLAGQATRQCQKDKTWAGVAPTCRQIVVQPWISCPDNIIQDLASGQGTADVSAVWKLPTSNVQQITINPPEISKSYRFPPGMTKVDWTATNSAGSASCSMYVIISDKGAPKVVSCPSDIYEISDVPKAMTWTEPTFSDNVKVTKVEQTFNSGDKFPIGPTKVKYDASDAAGNRISCEFTVTLKRPACYDPYGPVGGTKTCNAVGSSSICSWNCPSGSNLYKLPPRTYFWSCYNGAWTPSDTLPECVVSSKKDPNTPCEEGRIEMTVYSLLSGTSLHCAKCPSGTHKSSKDDCSPCPAGTYNDQQGQMQCTQQCPSGTSSLPGARSAEECKPPCPAGKISADGLGPNCQDCPRDTYQDKAQQTSCISCPSGTTTVAKGSNSPNHCGVKPNISPAPQEVTINEKETASVDCYASGKPTPTFKWKFLRDIPADFLGKMSQGSLNDANQNVIGSRLTITGATVENTGSYECVVTNSHGSDMALAKINVKPVINNQEGSGSQPI